MYRLTGIALATSICMAGQALTADGSVRMWLEAKDRLVVGEISVMREAALVLTIANDGDSAVRLPTGATTRWMADSQYWRISVDGPVDARCEEHQLVGVGDPPPGEHPHVRIGPREKKRIALPGLGLGNEGRYRISVEYRGEGAPPGDLQTRMRTNEVTLRIAPATPTEEGAVAGWREKNPDAPWCMFPQGIAPETLVDKYPTSLYAGWQLWSRLRSHLGGFPGEPSAADPTVFVESAIGSKATVLYEEHVRVDGTRNEHSTLRNVEAARWRRDKIEAFLSAHPDFEKADEMRLRLAMDYIGLGSFQAAERELNRIVGRKSVASEKAAEYLSLLASHTEALVGMDSQ